VIRMDTKVILYSVQCCALHWTDKKHDIFFEWPQNWLIFGEDVENDKVDVFWDTVYMLTSETGNHSHHYTMTKKQAKLFVFQNFYQISTKFDNFFTDVVQRISLCAVHLFPTSTNLCHAH